MKYFTTEEIKKQRKSEIAEHYKGYEGRNLKDRFAVKTVEDSLEKYVKLTPAEAKLLDYGSASGAFFGQLHEEGFKNLHGLDLENYLDEANKLFVKEMKTADCNSDQFPWTDNFFDIITAWCFLPHLENPHHAIRETLRILKPGGLFILSIPHLLSRASVKYFLKNKDFARYHPEKNHITAFTPGIFQMAVLKYFQTLEMRYLIDPRSLRGWKGAVRRWILNLSEKTGILKNYFEERWGYNQVWILKKV